MKRTYNVDDLPAQLRRHIEVVDGHWLWTGRCTQDGYGQVRWKRRTRLAHAVIYALATGQSIVPGLVHRHGQDCPRNCCNPAHINIGTQKDNCGDRDAAGRTARGSRNGRAKLHEEWIPVIRWCYRRGLATKSELARCYRVDFHTIDKAIRSENWKYV